MTKAITATAVGCSSSSKADRLDDPLGEVMPELRQIQILEEDGTSDPPVRPPTLRDLLRHTSGFAYFFTSPDDPRGGPPQPRSRACPCPTSSRRVSSTGGSVSSLAGSSTRARRGSTAAGWASRGQVVERSLRRGPRHPLKGHIPALGPESTGYNLAETLMDRRVTVHARVPGTGTLVPMPDVRPIPMERFTEAPCSALRVITLASCAASSTAGSSTA